MDKIPARIAELVETFDRHVEAYRSQQYNETQLRREFIDPFFEELGWDVPNKAGYAQAYKDVIHEDAIKVGGATKAPDYCFRIGGVRKFFLEAKKPSVDIKGDPHPAYQLRRYAWSAKLPLSVLTDFEEFAVYDCRIRPRHTDKADAARIMLFNYKDYLKDWSEIAEVFSKEAILKGSFDKFAAATKGKRGTSTVDKEFLSEIETWRGMLARIIALRNRALSVREINFAVQRTIDRILFLRMCEDRGIELYGQLQAISSGERTYPRLCEVFERADQRYNSGLFHFHEEPNRPEPPDQLTPNLAIDDKDLKWILHSLYYPQSPYEFSVLPAEILGNVYEQFLGKVITLTSGHRATVEDKPEVKKAGGVYYTPSYIVDYIVKNTVGRLLGDFVIPSAPVPSVVEGAEESVFSCHSRESGNPPAGQRLTPKQVSNIKILDPACGSGSFLIGAYQYLLDWHLKYYTESDPEKHAKGREPKIYEANSIRHCEESFDEAQDELRDEIAGMACATISNYRLTIAEKKRILLNSIFGVDIDSQAVEVTKLSLLLKVLEGESSETIENQYRLFHERALPDLAANIKCGNSLIGPDFFDNLDPSVIASEPVPSAVEGAEESVQAGHSRDSSCHSRDPSCHSRESGNPDDLRTRINAFDWHAEFPEIFTRPNPGFDAVIGNPPYGADFPDITLSYLKPRFSTCVWRCESYMLFVEKAVRLLSKGGHFGYIIPDTYLNLRFTQPLRELLLKSTVVQQVVSLPASVFAGTTVDTTLLFVEKADPSEPYHESEVQVKTFNKKRKIDSITNPDYEFHVATGLWHEHSAFLVHTSPQQIAMASKIESENHYLCDYADVFYGIKVYQVGKGTPPQTEAVLEVKPFTSESKVDGSFSPLFDGKHIARYALLWKENNWVKYGSWVAEPRKPEKYEGEKLLIRKIVGKTLIATYYAHTSYCNTLLYVLKLKPKTALTYLYLLGILNSQSAAWYFRRKFQISDTDTFPQIMIRDILKLPVPHPGKSDHDRVAELVERMLDLHKQLAAAKIPAEKTRIQRQIDATDHQIDKLVYELYGLTEEEIRIVEGEERCL